MADLRPLLHDPNRCPVLNLVGGVVYRPARLRRKRVCATLGLRLCTSRPGRRFPPTCAERDSLLSAVDRATSVLGVRRCTSCKCLPPDQSKLADYLCATATCFGPLASAAALHPPSSRRHGRGFGSDARRRHTSVGRPRARQAISRQATRHLTSPSSSRSAPGRSSGRRWWRASKQQAEGRHVAAPDLVQVVATPGGCCASTTSPGGSSPATTGTTSSCPTTPRDQLHEIAAQVAHARPGLRATGASAHAAPRPRRSRALFAGAERHRQDDGRRGARPRARPRPLPDRPRRRREQVHRRDREEPPPASSTPPRRAARSCSSTRPTRSSASAREVQDSHDRYANIEIDYLLQRMETYRGLAILATNLRSLHQRATQ